ncbi:MAG: allantoinase AllB [Nitriliruptoraceae bacterium]|nr:allantoinase AllB [Nitriliruptoraceae bacterium]
MSTAPTPDDPVRRPTAVRSTRVVCPDGVRPATVLLADGRITAVTAHEERPPGCLDVDELLVLPGFVDSHVHVNEPGRTEWEGFATATHAAALAGITTIVDMPLNSLPPTVDVDALAVKREAARAQVHVDVAFWGGVVPGSEGHIGALAAAGVCGFKLFTCDSGVPEFGGFPPDGLRDVLTRTGATGLPLIVHAEDPAVLAAHTPPPDADPRAYASWLDSRPPDTEVAAITALIDAVRATGAPAHVLHLSAADALHPLRQARGAGLPITVETCPHYLCLQAEDIADGDPRVKCAPPVRDAANRAALWEAVHDGTIDAVVSDHSPSPAAGKHLDSGDVLAAWGGIASLQLGPSLVLTERPELAPTRLADLMATGPARIAGLPAKGRIVAGADADLAIVDPDHRVTVDAGALAHRHPITPYDGWQLTGATRHTVRAGQLIVEDGTLVAPATGRLLTRSGPTG